MVKAKGEFKMLAVHSKASFVMTLDHQKKFEDHDNKNYSKFLEKMKEIEAKKYRGVDNADNKR